MASTGKKHARFFLFSLPAAVITAALLVLLGGAFLFATCAQMEGIFIPSKEPPHKTKLNGKIIFYEEPAEEGSTEAPQKIYTDYQAVMVHLYRKSDQAYLGQAPVDQDTLTWALELTAENATEALFWVELVNKRQTYYNSGSTDALVDGMYYELHVQPYSDTIKAWIPLFKGEELQKIGGDAAYPADGNYILVKDISINAPWQPVGSGGSLFSGTFYGRNNRIHLYGLTGGSGRYSGRYSGIFSRISGAVLSNINIELHNVTVNLNIQSAPAFGILAGCIEGTSVITDTVIYGDRLTVTKNEISEAYIGGIAGIMRDGAKIKNCANNAELACEIRSKSHTVYLGGIAGLIDGEAAVFQCANFGEIKITGLQSDTAAGGIAGGIAEQAKYVTPQIYDSYSTGAVSSQGVFSAAGGIAGLSSAYAYIQNCWSSGGASAVTADGEAYSAGILALSRAVNPNSVVMPDPPTINRIFTCAVFKQTVTAEKDRNAGAAAANLISNIDCPDCADGLLPCDMMSSYFPCACEWQTSNFNMVFSITDDSTGVPVTNHYYNVTEEECTLMINGQPVPGKDVQTCHNGQITRVIKTYQLLANEWNFKDTWYWFASMPYPGLLGLLNR